MTTYRPQDLRIRMKEFTVLPSITTPLLYDRAKLNVFPIDLDIAEILNTIISEIDALSDDSPAWGTIGQLLENCARNTSAAFLDSATANVPSHSSGCTNSPIIPENLRSKVPPHRHLHKLAINIANDCNLGCTYCYANKGLYGTSERLLINEQEIETIISRFADRFDFISSVQFMGGEPSMNPSAIQRAGEVFQKMVDEGRLLGLPTFTMITNGLRFTSKFIDAVKRTNSTLTVSLDGPEAINDSVRMKANGEGSYNAIRRSIQTATDAGITIGFEATFSRRHLEHGFSLIDLCQWFFNEFGVRVLHAPPMSENRYDTEGLGLTNEEKIQQYCSVTEWGIDNLLDRHIYLMHGFTSRLLDSFESKIHNRHICPAGNSLLSVSTKGEVYPCWMYTDEPAFKMGSVNDDILSASGENVLRGMQKYELHSHPECRSCLIQPVCFGCKGGDYHTTGTQDGKTNCDFMRAMVATFVARFFDRPQVPCTTSEYLSRPSYGEQHWRSLRPRASTQLDTIGDSSPARPGSRRRYNSIIPLTPLEY